MGVLGKLGFLPVCLLCATLLLWAGSTVADQYRQVAVPRDGRGIAFAPPEDPSVCVLWGKNLNYFAKRNAPLSCERPIAPKFSELSRPNWRKLDPRQHIDLLRKLDRALFYDLPAGMGRPFVEEQWRQRLGERLDEGSIGLSVVDLDLNADGSPEKVVKYKELKCAPNRGEPRPGIRVVHYFVFDEGMTQSQQVTILGFGADLLLYKGHVYAEWIDDDGDAWLDEFFGGPPPGSPSECYRRFMPDRCPEDQRPDFAFVRVCQYKFQLVPSKGGKQK